VEEVIANDTAGSPMVEGQRWTNRSPADISDDLFDRGFEASADTVRRILFDDLGLSRRQAYKDEAAYDFPHRDEQFQYIAQLRAEYEAWGEPVLSIDTKKKEILGNFYRDGRAYTDGRVIVQDHDFVAAQQRLVPYGVFDTLRNEGFLLLARGADTSELACDAIWGWWRRMGRYSYRHKSRLLVLCDCGGSNGYRRHRFKQDLCELAAALGRDIRVAHYPPGCSKYNPIEHRLFCHVTRSLRATVLKTIEIARNLIARTTTVPGLRVVAEIASRMYEKGRKATAEFLENRSIHFDDFLPQLNYTAPAAYRWMI